MPILYKMDFPNGKSYIGITTKSIAQRLWGHRAAMRSGSSCLLYRAWRLHGSPVVYEIDFLSGEDIFEREILAIAAFDTLTPNGYNMTPGGEMSPMLVPEIVAKLIGRKMSADAVSKMRAKKIGSMTEEHRALLRKLHSNNTYRLGKGHSPETKERLRAAAIGNKAALGHKKSAEALERCAASMRGKRHSEATKEKMRIAQRARRAAA